MTTTLIAWWAQITYSNILSTLALLVSIGALWVSWHFGRPQRQLARKQLIKAAAEDEKQKTAFVNCRIVGPDNAQRIQFGNEGPADARNISVDWADDPEVEKLFSYEAEQLPWKRLRAHDSFSVRARLYMESPERFELKVSWDDDTGQRKTETQAVSRMG